MYLSRRWVEQIFLRTDCKRWSRSPSQSLHRDHDPIMALGRSLIMSLDERLIYCDGGDTCSENQEIFTDHVSFQITIDFVVEYN